MSRPEALVKRIRELERRMPEQQAELARQRAELVGQLAEQVGVREAAARLGVTKTRVYQLIDRKEKEVS